MLNQSEQSACGCSFFKEVFAVEACQKICWFSLLNLAELVPLCFVVIVVVPVSQFLVILFASAEEHVFRGGSWIPTPVPGVATAPSVQVSDSGIASHENFDFVTKRDFQLQMSNL